jgi:hypothetical protein
VKKGARGETWFPPAEMQKMMKQMGKGKMPTLPGMPPR